MPARAARRCCITYHGGDGNDVVLNTQPVIVGSGTADVYTLDIDPATHNVRLTLQNGATVEYATLPPNFTIYGLGGDDKLIIDYANGDPLPSNTSGFSLDFEGGDGSDTIVIRNSTQDSRVYAHRQQSRRLA